MSIVTCHACVFWRMFGTTAASVGTCHRHAPPPGEQIDDRSYWPETLAEDGCAEGLAAPAATAAIIACRDCLFWFRRTGQTDMIPERRGDLPRIWWQNAAYCARLAPAPESSVIRTRWRATHASDGCGDGKPRKPA